MASVDRKSDSFPLLKQLNDESIFSVTLIDEKSRAEFMEECDHWFAIELTKAEVLALAEELKRVGEEMVDEPTEQ